MDQLVQAMVLGIVQGLTEFLPVSSSGHLIVVPALLGWHDPFIDSLAFSVMLHMATLLALLVYFRADWLRLIPAGLAAIRDRSLGDDPDRRLAWLLAVATIPAVIVGLLLGHEAIAGMLMVGTIAGVLLATVLNNGGGAWDNAKKYIESGHLLDDNGNVLGKKTPAHAAAVVGDTVGDPFKDTAGPSLHVLVKLLATITLVLAPLFIR